MLRLAVQPLGFPERLRKVLEVVIAQAFVVDWQLSLWTEKEARGIDVLVQLVSDRFPATSPVVLPDKAPKWTAVLRVGDVDRFSQAPFSIDRHVLFSQLVSALVMIGDNIRQAGNSRSTVPPEPRAPGRPTLSVVPSPDPASMPAPAVATAQIVVPAPMMVPTRTGASSMPTAMVVDGSRQARLLITAELSAMGFATEAFEDAAAALTHARQHAVALAVIETELAGPVDGISLCRLLRDIGPEPVSVLMLTNQGGTLERLRALVSGSQAYLVKPVDRITFRSEVHRLLAAHEHELERTH